MLCGAWLSLLCAALRLGALCMSLCHFLGRCVVAAEPTAAAIAPVVKALCLCCLLCCIMLCRGQDWALMGVTLQGVADAS